MNQSTDFKWLKHNGEMAKLIREYDWSSTPIGAVSSWPMSLKISINIMLNSGIAMTVCWGKTSTYFYNDQYKPILMAGGKHPQALGKSMYDIWPEVWPTVGALHKQVLETGEEVHFDDYKFVLQRGGRTEDAYFNFSYSPLYDDDQKPCGILTACVETTKIHKANKLAESSRKELYDFFMQSPSAMCILMGPEHRFSLANKLYTDLVGREVMGRTVEEVFSPEESKIYKKALDEVYQERKPFLLVESPLNLIQSDGRITERFLTTSYTPFVDDDGASKGILVQIQDVTSHVKTRAELEIEKENYRNLFRQTPEMICSLIGPEHTFSFVNEAHIKALGFDATGMKVREAQPESVEIHGILDEVYRTGVTAHLREIPVTLGTKIRYFNLTYAARKNHKGIPDGVMILGAEITDQVEARMGIIKANYEAQLSLNKLDTIVHNLTEGLVFIDPNGKVIYMNPESLRIHQFEGLHDYLIQIDQFASFLEVYDLNGVLLPVEDWPISRVVNGEKFVDYEVVVKRSDSGHVWVGSFSGIRVLNADGSPLMSVLSVKDITPKKTIEIELKEALKARDEFLSIASHELRTPLTSLKMQLQLTNRGLKSADKIPSPEKIQKVMDVSLKQVERLTSLIEDLLDVSRIQSGKLTHRFEPVKIKELIEELIDRFSEQSHQTNTPITFLANVDPILNCDPFRIDQVLTNLISNTLKYASGKPVDVVLDGNDEYISIQVIDQGMGIAKSKIPLIFNRFERAAAETNISGLGLGLYITKSIIDAHHGQINVESELGQGTTFTVLLPLT